MTNREFFVQRMTAELPAFRKVLQALPPDHLDYKPHESSPSAQQIVWTLAREWEISLNVVHENKGEWTNLPAPAMNEMVARFEEAWNGVTEGVAKLDDATWDTNAQFYFGGKMVSEQPVGQFLWFILFDAIHHRGQLTTYIRPMGGKVPAVYGPSADERPRP